jgi:hypothetical protein
MEQGDEEQQQQQQQGEVAVVVNRFDQQLIRLRGMKQSDSFSFRDTIDTHERPVTRWTMEQALTVSEALMTKVANSNNNNNNGLGTLFMDLAVCRPNAVSLFLNYIKSTKSLKHLFITYDRTFLRDIDSEELQQIYFNEMDKICHTMQSNTSITELTTTWLEKWDSLFHLLSKTTTLKTFEVDPLRGNGGDDGDDPTYESAFRTAGGFSHNTSLKRVKLSCTNEQGQLSVLVSGLNRHPSLEDLSVAYSRPSIDLYCAISKVLHFTPTVENLLVDEECCESDDFSDDVNFDWMLLDLYNPSLGHRAGANLKVLCLVQVRIGMGWEKIYESEPFEPGNVNNVLEELTLDKVIFIGCDAVKLMITELCAATQSHDSVKLECKLAQSRTVCFPCLFSKHDSQPSHSYPFTRNLWQSC